MNGQAEKQALSMAGEFLVAGELLRRGVKCSVTYGNAKRADLIAFSDKGECFVTLEVKTTSKMKWMMGSSIPEPGDGLWIFVYLPSDTSEPPEFFVLTSTELNGLMVPTRTAYIERYRKQKENRG